MGFFKTGNTTITGSQTDFVTSDSASPYAVTDADYYVAIDSTPAPVTVQLPATPITGRHIIVADSVGMSPSNNITVDGGANFITAGGTSSLTQVINSAFSSYDMTFDGSKWISSQSAALRTRFPITTFVVGPLGKAGYQSVQNAINAANAVGGGTVWIQPGTYTENLTLADKVILIGSGIAGTSDVIIVGTHTPVTGAGMIMGFQSLELQNPAGSIISSAAAGLADFNFTDVRLYAGNGYTLDLANWTTAATVFLNCSNSIAITGGTTDGIVNSPASEITFNSCAVIGYGTNALNVLTIGSSGSAIEVPVVLNGLFSLCQHVFFGAGVTITGTDTYGHFYGCDFFNAVGGQPALTYSSTQTVVGQFINCDFFTDNNPAIQLTGSPFVEFTNALFVSNENIAGSSTNVTWGASKTGNATFLGNTETNGNAQVDGNVTLPTAGSKIIMATGVNAAIGQSAALAASTVNVPTTAVSAASLIQLTHGVAAGTLGQLSVGTITPGVGFDINTDNPADTSLVNWIIFN